MKTIIKVDNKELFEFENTRNFVLGEELKCYGEPYIVVSMDKRKLNRRDTEEMVVTLIEKSLYEGIRIESKDFDKFGIAIPKHHPVGAVTVKVTNAPKEYDKNPFLFGR